MQGYPGTNQVVDDDQVQGDPEQDQVIPEQVLGDLKLDQMVGDDQVQGEPKLDQGQEDPKPSE